MFMIYSFAILILINCLFLLMNKKYPSCCHHWDFYMVVLEFTIMCTCRRNNGFPKDGKQNTFDFENVCFYHVQ